MTGEDHKKCKDIKKNIIKKAITHDDYKECLFSKREEMRKMVIIRSEKHELYTQQISKVALSAEDDKRVIMEDGISTLAYGHFSL